MEKIQMTIANQILLFERNCQKLVIVKEGHPLETDREHTIVFVILVRVVPLLRVTELGSDVVSMQVYGSLVMVKQKRLN
jgi:hypothetical protein